MSQEAICVEHMDSAKREYWLLRDLRVAIAEITRILDTSARPVRADVVEQITAQASYIQGKLESYRKETR